MANRHTETDRHIDRQTEEKHTEKYILLLMFDKFWILNIFNKHVRKKINIKKDWKHQKMAIISDRWRSLK